MPTQALTIGHASAMPASTWHFLNMNDTSIEVPAGLALAPDVQVSRPWAARAAADEFDNALADAEDEWLRSHPAPTEDELAKRAAFMAAEADATYGGTARSAYQVRADALEETRSLVAAFEHGVGAEAAAYLRYAAGERIVIEADPGEEVEAEVLVAAVPDAVSVAAVDVIADAGSTVRLALVVDGESGGAQGIAGTTVRVFADRGAKVVVDRVQTLGEGLSDVDDMALFASDGAFIEVRQSVLGAARSYAGLAGDLRGDASRIDVDTRYLGHGAQVLDFNYSLRHHGVKSRCNLQANGVLTGASTKSLRGTIDFVRGCKGAEGAENETVLLVDERVHNKTVPVILCNEDDVAGNHGATIGHVREEQMFYLTSRGFSPREAEVLFTHAIIEQAVLDAPSDAAREAVVRFGERLSPGFADEFDKS